MFIKLRTTTARRVALAGSTLLLAGGLVACGAGEKDGGASGDTSTDQVDAAAARAEQATAEFDDFPQVAPVAGAEALAGKTVWYVPLGTAAPILKAMGDGTSAALAHLDVDVHICDGKFVPTEVAKCLEQASTAGADAVVTSFVDYGLIPAAYDALVDKGIPVLLAGAVPSPDRPADAALAYDDTSVDHAKGVERTADAVIADSKGKANILFLGVTDSPALLKTADHAEKYYADECPGCTVTRIDTNTASLSKLASQVSAELIKNPDIDYIVGEIDESGAPAIAGIQSAGRDGKVKLASTNGNLDALQRIKADDTQIADTGLSPAFWGWRFADGIVRMMTGSEPSTTGAVVRLFTADNVGDLDLTPAGYATNEWYGEDGYQDLFLTAWGAR
ncbi:sugar ABC transporter substrate-binding protein [Nocardioides currus]|uniref:Periplasmic binding protein domain-containing protein n=1 Tax=Nocardioides currus TaxID=2133958 RepID=A0A2R7YT07_9ACTN|nr:substrate-binding domain-containing protein [Nocardioides currus]PUA79520.1 hypothetical protein C7S10_19335 [Nocardioides currus]